MKRGREEREEKEKELRESSANGTADTFTLHYLRSSIDKNSVPIFPRTSLLSIIVSMHFITTIFMPGACIHEVNEFHILALEVKL